MARKKKPANPFRGFGSSPEVISLVVMMYVRYPLSLRNVEDHGPSARLGAGSAFARAGPDQFARDWGTGYLSPKDLPCP
jgi:hypothetical protein